MVKDKSLDEPIIDSDLPICDAHQHFCYYPTHMNLPFAYGIAELAIDLQSGHNITATVFINCDYRRKALPGETSTPVLETENIESIANSYDHESGGQIRVGAGIVSFVDLKKGRAIVPMLEAHITASPKRFRGIRYMTCWDPDPGVTAQFAPKGLMLEPVFREGISCLKRYNLSFDAWLYHPQIPDLVDLAMAFPETTFILDHLGGPLGVGSYASRREEVFHNWRKNLIELSAVKNVYLKIGGFGVGMLGFNWEERPDAPTLAGIIRPYILTCIEVFGVERCMFESDFPVDKKFFSYVDMWNAYKMVTRSFSESEKRMLFYGTAAKAYRIS